MRTYTVPPGPEKGNSRERPGKKLLARYVLIKNYKKYIGGLNNGLIYKVALL